MKGFVDEVAILCGGREIARHPRHYGEGVFVADPLHYLLPTTAASSRPATPAGASRTEADVTSRPCPRGRTGTSHVDKPGLPFQGVGIGRETYGPPRRQVASAVRPEQSAQTYPAFRRAVGQDGEPRVLVLIKGPASSAILRRRVPGHRLTVRPSSFGDGFSVPVVVLLRLDAGTNIFGRHQPHLVALRGQSPSHMVSAAAHLLRDDTSRCLGAECHHGVASHAAAEQTLPAASRPTRLQLFLPRSIPIIASCIDPLPSHQVAAAAYQLPHGEGRAIHKGGRAWMRFDSTGDAVGMWMRIWVLVHGGCGLRETDRVGFSAQILRRSVH